MAPTSAFGSVVRKALAQSVAQHGDGADGLADGGEPRGLVLQDLHNLLFNEVHQVEDEGGEFGTAECHELLRLVRSEAVKKPELSRWPGANFVSVAADNHKQRFRGRA
jgi:hypothetical protein